MLRFSSRPGHLFRRPAPLLFALALYLPLTSPIAAHHSFVREYNGAKKITLKGVISEIEFANPHVFIMVRVRTKKGGEVIWRIESESIPVMKRKGLNMKRLKQGAKVRVIGWPARDGSAGLGLSVITIGGKSVKIRGVAR